MRRDVKYKFIKITIKSLAEKCVCSDHFVEEFFFVVVKTKVRYKNNNFICVEQKSHQVEEDKLNKQNVFFLFI